MDQAERRETAFPRDQHGRKWEAQYDIIARAPCSALMPSGWRAPWLPPDHYLVTDPKDNRSLVIDYPALVRDRRAAAVEYQRQLRESARKYGVAGVQMLEAQTLPDGRKIPHQAILEEIGPAPLSDVFPRAAMQGNRWVLGLPKPNGEPYPVPPWAEVYLFELDVQSTETYELDAAEDVGLFPDVDDVPSHGMPRSTEFPDVDDETDPRLALAADVAADLEEDYDPGAVGGARIPTRSRRRQQAGV
jgi:hypothetical protein